MAHSLNDAVFKFFLTVTGRQVFQASGHPMVGILQTIKGLLIHFAPLPCACEVYDADNDEKSAERVVISVGGVIYELTNLRAD